MQRITKVQARFCSTTKPKQARIFQWTFRSILATYLTFNLIACNLKTPLFPTPKNQVLVTAMMADLEGALIIRDGCLRVKTAETNEGYSLVWPPEVRMTLEGDHIRVESGLVSGIYEKHVFKPGDTVRLAGGMVGKPNEQLLSTIPPGCPGPYWVVGSNLSLFSPTTTPSIKNSPAPPGYPPSLGDYSLINEKCDGKECLFRDDRALDFPVGIATITGYYTEIKREGLGGARICDSFVIQGGSEEIIRSILTLIDVHGNGLYTNTEMNQPVISLDLSKLSNSEREALLASSPDLPISLLILARPPVPMDALPCTTLIEALKLIHGK